MDMKHEVSIDAPASEAWRVLGVGFGNICEWSATLKASHLVGELGVGATRSCEGTGFGPFPAGVVTEELTLFDPETMRFTYVARTGLPAFVKHAQNAWSVVSADGDRCRVRFHATVQMAWWALPVAYMLPWLLRADVARMTEEMKHQIEQGTPHPRALAAKR